MSSYLKCIHMLYSPKVEMAVLKWKALFVGLNSPKICFMPVFIFPTFICFPLVKKVEDLVYCLKARIDCLSCLFVKMFLALNDGF